MHKGKNEICLTKQSSKKLLICLEYDLGSSIFCQDIGLSNCAEDLSF